jgi:beta-glucosidase
MRVVVAFVVLAVSLSGQAPPPYKNASLPVADRVRDLVGRMTLEEKFWQMFMIPGDLDDPAHDYSNGAFGLQISGTSAKQHAERINAIQKYFVEKTRLGIPIIPFEEALHGVKADGATVFPQAIALAATWDRALMQRVSEAAARETRTRGIRQALSPVVNIADDVRWGRVEETYGEDPFLSAEMGRMFVEAFEKAGVIATPKHWVANVGEGGRDSYPVFHNERMLMERYFPPFEATIRGAGARSVMTAYNSVDGLPATQNKHLMNEVLKRDWAFGGFIISDAAATGGATVLHMTEASTPVATAHAVNSGLDVIFQSSYPQHRPYLAAFQQGLIPVATIDAAVSRVLKAKFELGLFENPYVDVAAAATANGSAAHLSLAREAARASIVLLKNNRNTLPLSAALRSIALIGWDAGEARLGGYSGPGVEPVSIVSGIGSHRGPGTTLQVLKGVSRDPRDLALVMPQFLETTDVNGQPVRGLSGQYWDNNSFTGAPRLTRIDQRIDFRWTLNSPGRGIPFDWYSARWTGTLIGSSTGAKRIAIEGNDGYRLWLDDTLVIDNWRKQSYGVKSAAVDIAPGSKHALKLEFFESTGIARVKLLWDAGMDPRGEDRAIAEAVTAAKASDAAIIVAGIEEGEFRDRAFLKLPGRQEELIEAVAATGKPVVVVLIGGSAITMSRWIDKVDAVIDAWYPGEQGGHGVADVIFGAYNPAGRLPVTFAMSEGQLPLSYNHKPTGRGDDYLDLTGMPLFPFGFGLSYSTFEYSGLEISAATISPTGRVTVACTVKNTGTRPGDEVVQLYIRDVLGSVARPVMELKGFDRIRLDPGQSRRVTFDLGPEHLKMLDENMKWIVEPGTFRVMVGASSKDLRLRGEFTVK